MPSDSAAKTSRGVVMGPPSGQNGVCSPSPKIRTTDSGCLPGSEKVPGGRLAAHFGPGLRGAVEDSVPGFEIRAVFDERPDDVEVPGLRGQVQGGGAFAVVRAAERARVVHVGAEVEER